MKKTFTLLLVLLLVAVGFSIINTYSASADKVQVVEAKVIPAAKAPTFDAIAYIAGHGGHIAVIDMRTMKPPTDMDKGRIVLTEAGSEMEGKIAGMSFEEVKKAGGTHGQSIDGEGPKGPCCRYAQR